MVPLMSPKDLLLGDAEKELLRELTPVVDRGNLEEAFAAWLLGESVIPFRLEDAVRKVATHEGGQRRYQDVAILGFAAAANLLPEIENQGDLKRGLIWLFGRDPLIGGQLQGFCTDAIALLGIVLGAKTLDNEDILSGLKLWLNKFMSRSFQSRWTDWQMCLLVAVCHIGGITPQKNLPEASSLADVRVALASKGCLKYEFPVAENDQAEALLLMKQGSDESMNCDRAALRLTAFYSIQKIVPIAGLTRNSVEDVSKILSRVPASFRRWTWENKGRTKGGEARKWHIDNEYHVQNFLYSLLAPYFPDLTDENYTKSVGQKNPRLDLGVPSLELIIEVKFMRARDSPQKIIDELAADASLQLVEGSEYRQILAFIWDDSRRSEEHDCLRRGLKQISGIVDVIVVSRPGNLTYMMEDSE